MPKFRKKPVVIEAEQYTGDTTQLSYEFGACIRHSIKGGPCIIDTLEGPLQCQVNDWIIKGVKGEFYPCKPDIFEQTYEPAEKKGEIK